MAIATYGIERFTAGRTVTDVAWSNKFSDLFAASYGSKKHATFNDEEGVVLAWSVGLTDRPEYIFTAQSPVLTVEFDKFNPNILIGGCYSGQVCTWDGRAGKRNPVMSTPLGIGNNNKGHQHPVYALDQIGTAN